MGLKAAFSRQRPSQDLFYEILKNKASNSKDFPEPRLFIKDVISQTWLQMSEVGSEAAATVMYESRYPVGTRKERLKPKVFRADHPFMFIIYHKPTKCILFMGRVTNPVEKAR